MSIEPASQLNIFAEGSQQDFYDYLVHCSNAYYNTGVSIIPDEEFDRLQYLYETRFGTSFTYLGKANRKKIQLPVLMPSLNKVKEAHALGLYIQTVQKTQSHPSFLAMAKIDGISCLYVKTPQKEQLMTRGNGSIGSDISSLLPYLPFRTFNTPANCIIRGELVLYRKDYIQHFNQSDPPRNIVSGLINSKTIQEKELSYVRFVGYYIHRSAPVKTVQDLQQWNIPTPLFKPIHKPTLSLLEDTLKEFKANASYDMDGLVLYESNSIEEPTIDNPRLSVAFKVQQEGCTARVLQVEWNPSRYGILCPRVQLEPVQLQGVTIQYATAFHAKYVKDHSIGPGAVLSIIRSGDVIPYIVDVQQPAEHPQMPSVPYIWTDDIHVRLKDTSDHTDLQVKQLTHFVDVLNLKGIKEATILKLFDSGIRTIDQLLFLTYDDLIRLDGMAGVKGANIKTCEKIAQALTTARQTLTLKSLLLGSSCFPAFGDKKMETALQAIPISDLLQSETLSVTQQTNAIQSLQRAGIKTIAKDFVDCLLRFKDQYKDSRVLDLAIQQIQQTPSAPSAISNKGSVVLTGFRDPDLQAQLISRGYQIGSTVSGKTVALIVQSLESTSLKIQEAQAKHVHIIDRQQALQLLL